MSEVEFSRPVRAHEVGQARSHQISAGPDECAALARRFDLLTLDGLEAVLELARTASGIRLTGRIRASGAQACVRTGTPVPFALEDRLALRLAAFITFTQFAIKSTKRLVEKQNTRAIHQCASNRDTLLLTTRHLARMTFGKFRHLNHVKSFCDTNSNFTLRCT